MVKEYTKEHTAREAIMEASKLTGISLAEVSRNIGWSPQAFNQKLHGATLRADEFFRAMDFMGVRVAFINRATGIELFDGSTGWGEPVSGVSNGERYDTEHATILATTFYEDGVNKYAYGFARELYVDTNGAYFFAEYFENPEKKPRVKATTPELAAEFIAEHTAPLKDK